MSPQSVSPVPDHPTFKFLTTIVAFALCILSRSLVKCCHTVDLGAIFFFGSGGLDDDDFFHLFSLVTIVAKSFSLSSA